MSAPNSCGVQYVTKGCQCLTDPMDPFNPICAYVGRDNGIVYPCDPGCCQPSCGTKMGHEPRMDVEFRQTFGGTLPPGFNKELVTSDEPSPTKGEAPFVPSEEPRGLVQDKATKLFWLILAILFFGLFIGLKI
jgi:hypothetical protein